MSRTADERDANVPGAVPSDADADLVAAVQEYMAEVDAGRRPNRQKFLVKHAHIAADLAACIQGLSFVQSAAAQIHHADQNAAPRNLDPIGVDLAAAQPLGDFKLVREIGRGGMGVVYEAVQLSLGRRVALKVLSMAGALDPRHLKRFRNEAQAAAQLHHTNIVPVYAVGCERSVHFYAMQLIEGQSLAHVIEDLRAMRPTDANPSVDLPAPYETVQIPRDANTEVILEPNDARDAAPSDPDDSHVRTGPPSAQVAEFSQMHSSNRASYFRAVAQLGFQAAEGLAYAHGVGVVHRDVKPANLLLDVRGNLWITDFGLAQLYEDGDLTRTGDLLGTFRYMSPEQASGRAVVLDQRTDIYSLGVTLYELLTLERAYPGQTRAQLLRQIGAGEFRPLRSVDRTIPTELATILAKAIAHEPAERYQTARELADDLGRFLRDEPILARPPSLWDKLVKWTRRHRNFAIAALVFLVLSAMGLLTTTVLVAREQAKTRAAYERERRNAAETSQQRDRAERSFRQARDVVDFFARIAADRMDRPELAPIRREMLEAALAYYQGFLDERSEDELSIGIQLDGARSEIATILAELSAFDAHFRAAFRVGLLANPAVARALGLSPDQQQTVSRILEGHPFGNPVATVPDLRLLTPEQKRERLADMTGAIDAELQCVLTPAQSERLRQIYRQVRGPLAFDEPDVAEILALSQDQRSTIRAIQANYRDARARRARGELSDDKLDHIRDHAVSDALNELTPAQLETWRRLTGPRYTGPSHASDDPVNASSATPR
jgi:hypothetical protein